MYTVAAHLRAATGLRAALVKFLLHENIFTVTFVEKGSYVRGYGIYAQLPHSFELISQSSYGFPFQQQSTFLGFSNRVLT